jgi:predicted transcriptional regulator
MKSITIRLPDEQHERLKKLATRRGVSLNKLFEELSTRILTETDAETRFRMRAAQGNVEAGLAVLDKLDAHYSG